MKFHYYVAKRVLLIIPVVFGILVMVFIVSHVFPTDPLAAILGPYIEKTLSPETRAAYEHLYHLDLPLYQQFFFYINGLLHGDLGRSITTGHAIMYDVQVRFPATIELAIYAMLIALGLGIPLGIVSAVKKDKIPDHVSRVFSIIGVAMPSFWLAILLLGLFYFYLGWLPPPGRTSVYELLPARITGLATVDALLEGNFDLFWDSLKHILLPAFCLGYRATATISRMTRSSMLEVMRMDYLRTARSKGLSERIVIMRHALKNAMIPTVTVSGLMFGGLLGGSVLVETVFSWPGLGYYVTQALQYVDVQAVMAVTLIFTLTYSFVNLAVDLIYGYLDPRIKY